MNDLQRIKYGFLVVLGGLAAVALIYVLAVWRWTDASDVATAVSSAVGVIGTLVGAFFGVQVGSAGKEKAEEKRVQAEDRLHRSEAQVRELAGTMPKADYEALRSSRAKLFD